MEDLTKIAKDGRRQMQDIAKQVMPKGPVPVMPSDELHNMWQNMTQRDLVTMTKRWGVKATADFVRYVSKRDGITW
jgi:hypothetical protein